MERDIARRRGEAVPVLSLAREANDPDVKKIAAVAKECDNLRAKVFALHRLFPDLEDSDAAEYIVKAALLCKQAKSILDQAISELS